MCEWVCVCVCIVCICVGRVHGRVYVFVCVGRRVIMCVCVRAYAMLKYKLTFVKSFLAFSRCKH